MFQETFGGNIGLHRYFSHNSFKTDRFWHFLLCIFSTHLGIGSIISWSGQHRYHHLHSDTPLDVHSPRHYSVIKILFGVWNIKIDRQLIRDFLSDRFLIFLHKNYWTIHISLSAIYFTTDYLFNTWLFFALYAFPNLLCLISGFSLAIVTHIRGYKNYQLPDDSRNCWIMNFLTLGEGWHNNHHANPRRYFQGEKWWEWDIPAVIIRLIATDLKSN